MLEIAATQGETIDVGLEFVLLLALGVVSLIGGMTTALKGRWGWFCLGLLTAGLIWPLTGLLVARADSPWARSFYGPPKLARARRRERG